VLSLFGYGGTMAKGGGGFSYHHHKKAMAMRFSHGDRF